MAADVTAETREASAAPEPAPGYGTREVARLLALTPAQLRSHVRAAELAPGRGPRGEHRFTFQDLILLRAAKGLLGAGVPARRVRQSLRALREQLPEGRPLSGLHISARGAQVIVRDGGAAWEPRSGQSVFDFSVSELARAARPLAHRAAGRIHPVADGAGADDWFELACDLEARAPGEARDAYRRALALDPKLVDAHVNLGKLLHDAGEVAAAEAEYREALALQPDHPTAAFNRGVALEDLGRLEEAVHAYEAVLGLEPGYADAHYNLAGLHEKRGDPAAALRHLKEYRRLTGPRR